MATAADLFRLVSRSQVPFTTGQAANTLLAGPSQSKRGRVGTGGSADLARPSKKGRMEGDYDGDAGGGVVQELLERQASTGKHSLGDTISN